MRFRLYLGCVVLLLCGVRALYRAACEENFCEKEINACPELTCKEGEGRLVKRATTCGCCDICITSLREGDSCKTEYYGINNWDLQECGPGLKCNGTSQKCEPAPTICVMQQKNFDDNPGNYSLKQRPQCDEFGDFKEVVCLFDALCYCVNKNGTRIFGTDTAANNDSMKCDCSRDINNFHREAEDEKFPRCLSNGNYDMLQCTEELCYCMESFDQDIVSINASLAELSCYDEEEHWNRLTSKCWQERKKEIYKNESYTEVIGLDLTKCDFDGNYSPVQCKKEWCFCVNKAGTPYKKKAGKVRRNTEEAEKLRCDCLRDKEFLEGIQDKTENMKRLEALECDDLGNYKQTF